MKILLKTKVKAHYKEILPQLSKKDLFQLACKLMGARLTRYDGHAPEDEYHIQFNFLFFRQNWIGLITDFVEDDDQVFFVDEGKELPFFLKLWKHKHAFVKIDEEHSQIVDDIDFATQSPWGDYCLYPFIFAHFLCRKSMYKFLVEKDYAHVMENLKTMPQLMSKHIFRGVR